MSKRTLALLAKVLSIEYSHAQLDHVFMLFSLEESSLPGSSKLKRGMAVVTRAETDPNQFDSLLALIDHVVEDRDLVARRAQRQLPDDALAFVVSLEKDGIVKPMGAAVRSPHSPTDTVGASAPERKTWDAFISHAGEDKAVFVQGLARELANRGLKVWYDEDVLKVGDSVRSAIDEGLNASDYGIVVISHDYMRKDWTNRELDGLLAVARGMSRLLPVWHGVTHEEVVEYSPIVAGRFAVRSTIGVVAVADALCRSMNRGLRPEAKASQSVDPAPGPQFLTLVHQNANSHVYAWVVVGGETEANNKFTDDEIETFIGWLSSFDERASLTLANSAFVRATVNDAGEKGGVLWLGEAHHGPVVNLLNSLHLNPLNESRGALVSLPGLTGWWARVTSALPMLAGNLRLRRVRLGFGMYPYGPNSIPVVGFDFGKAPATPRRAEYHQIPPWHAFTPLFDPYDPPPDVLEGPLRDLLDAFSYGRADRTVEWMNNRFVEGALKTEYRGPDRE